MCQGCLASNRGGRKQRVLPETLFCQWLILLEALLQELKEFLNCDESSSLAGVDFFHATLKLTGDWCGFWSQANYKCAFHDPTVTEWKTKVVFFWWNFDLEQRKMLRIATLVPVAPTAARASLSHHCSRQSSSHRLKIYFHRLGAILFCMAGEEHQEESRSPAKKWSFGMGSILPVVALGMSLFSLYTSELARKDVARIDVIKTEYGLFHELAQLQLQYPLMEHLFTASEEAYDSNVARIKVASSSASDQERAKLLLQERALAHYIFTTYEEAFYLWQQSLGNDKRRAELAHDDLLYFNDSLCSNPRLLWYWDSKQGGSLDRAFAGELRHYYQEHVSKECPTPEDPAGPFGR